MFEFYHFEHGVEGCYANAWGEKHLRQVLAKLLNEILDDEIKSINDYFTNEIKSLSSPVELKQEEKPFENALYLLNSFTAQDHEWKVEDGKLILFCKYEPNEELTNYDHPKFKNIIVKAELQFFEMDELTGKISKGEIPLDSIWTLHHSECKDPDYLEKGIHIANVLGYCIMPQQIDLAEDPLEDDIDKR